MSKKEMAKELIKELEQKKTLAEDRLDSHIKYHMSFLRDMVKYADEKLELENRIDRIKCQIAYEDSNDADE